MDIFLESCCTSVDEVVTACARGAGRIELCENLAVGGVTPSEGLISEVLEVATVPVNVLVRPRGGDFCFSPAEISRTIQTVGACRRLGAAGVVVGALDRRGDVDLVAMERIVGEARGARALSVTFHRAFDVCRDPLAAFDAVRSLGCDRLLTSGHEDDAFKGRFFIAELVRRAAGGIFQDGFPGEERMSGNSILVMPGCGVRASNVGEIRRVTGAVEFHASASFWDQGLE